MPTAQQIGMQLYNPFIPPQTQAKLMAVQQQEALAEALLEEGRKPVSTDNRSINGVGYAVSPLEGLAKMMQSGVGAYKQNKANEAYANILNPSSNEQSAVSNTSGENPSGTPGTYQSPNAVTQGGNPMQVAMQGLMSQFGMSQAEAWQVLQDPSALGRLYAGIKTPEMKNAEFAFGAQAPQIVRQNMQNELGKGYYAANPGQQSLATAAGTNAAGLLPPGAMPGGPQTGAVPPVQSQGAIPLPPGLPQLAQANPEATAGTQQIPQINASQIAPPSALPPPQPSPLASVSGPGTPPPDPRNYNTTVGFQTAMKGWEEGQKAQAQVVPAGEKTQVEDTGKNIADAQKTYNVAAAMLPRAMQRFSQLRQASQDASYGGGVSDEEAGKEFHIIPPDYARSYARTMMGQITEPKRATANQIIEQAANQGILSELGPQLAGLRGNKFLESIASSASGLNSADPPPAKLNAINGLQDQYISNLKSLADQRRSYGEKNVPTDLELAQQISQYADPNTKISVTDPKGNLGRVDPGHLIDLIQSGGKLR